MRVVEAAARRMPSIEREPKALSLEELNSAREAALSVLSTHSSEDAGRIFTQQGLKPVVGIRRNVMDSDDDGDDGEDMFDRDAFVDDQNARRQHGRTAKKRDVATAPF